MGQKLLESLECFGGIRKQVLIPWHHFDVLKCEEAEGHDHSKENEDEAHHEHKGTIEPL